MSGGYRSFILAACGFLTGAIALFLILAPADGSDDDSGVFQNASYAEYSPGGPSCDPKTLSGLTGRKAADERYRCQEATEEYRLKADDLVQQTRSAAAAEAMTNFALDQTRLLLLGTILGGLTLIAAFAAANYARRAAEAAELELGQSKELSHIELRAYLDFDSPVMTPIAAEDPETSVGYRLVFNFKNYGSTPAVNARYRYFFEFGDDVPLTADCLCGIDWDSIGTIAQGDHSPIAIPTDLLKEDDAAIRKGEAHLCFICELMYEDVFKAEHRRSIVLQTNEEMTLFCIGDEGQYMEKDATQPRLL